MFYGVRNDGPCFYYGDLLSDLFQELHQKNGSTLHLSCSRDIDNPLEFDGVVKTKGYV